MPFIYKSHASYLPLQTFKKIFRLDLIDLQNLNLQQEERLPHSLLRSG